MIDYWGLFHKIALKYNYDIPEHIVEKFKKTVCNNIRAFAINLKRLKFKEWSINVYYEQNQHFYRLKLKYKGHDICSYYKDKGQVIRRGKYCNQVPKEIDKFLTLVVANCWHVIVKMIEEKDDVYDFLSHLIWQYKETKRISCEED